MLAVDIVLTGLIIGGIYALTALGLTLQYGVARIMNLSYGEFVVAAALSTYWLYTTQAMSPLIALVLVVPLAFVLNWLIYQFLLHPLVRRARNEAMLEVDSILATFGLLFIIQGIAVLTFGGNYLSYSYLSIPVQVIGSALAVNRLLALAFAVVIGGAIYLALIRTRLGTAIRAVAVDPVSAQLVAIDVRRASAFAFALGGALVASAGVLISMFLTFNASMGVEFTMKALIVVIMGGVGNMLGAIIAGLLLGIGETAVARLLDPGLTLAATYALFLAVLLIRPTGLFGRPARSNRSRVLTLGAGAVLLAGLAMVPLAASAYHLALGISLLYFAVLATAWALFSGTTHYISLATVAFFGVGAYTVAVVGEILPWPLVLALAAAIGVALALVVGLSTLRLSGIYFVIFSFGLSELIRQLVTWYEVNIHRSVGRYVFLDITQAQIYWQLLALTAAVLLTGHLLGRSRLGLALRVIGADEVVARHAGIDTTRAKLATFALSALFMTLTGAVMAPRWTYIDPAIAFNTMLSFEVVIMALFGGAGVLFGPILGVVPFVLLFEFLSANFPNYFSILLGLVFLAVVYALPEGVAGFVQQRLPRTDRAGVAPLALPVSATGAKLEVKSLRKTFGGLVAVDNLSFAVPPGEIIGLIGPNGSGKTTVLNLISGALPADAGTVLCGGVNMTGLGAHRIARLGLARTFQLVRVLEAMTAVENVMVGLAFRGKPLRGTESEAVARGLLARVGLANKADQPAAQLTYIDQKRLELARALALEPRVLLLDEWLAGLNRTELDQGIKLIHSLRGEGLTIILVEHVMDAIRSLCDCCIVMNAGRKIAEGTAAVVLSEPEVIRAYLGEPDA